MEFHGGRSRIPGILPLNGALSYGNREKHTKKALYLDIYPGFTFAANSGLFQGVW
jgi:hypothetical protein